jgi:Winged helix DNA-binding domain
MPAARRHAGPSPAPTSIAARRLAAQQIARPAFRTPGDLVTWMGAVQAQDPAAARWAVGLRLARGCGAAAHGATQEATIDGALADGSVVRTHVMRWTWQLVAPADLHWMLPLVAARLTARAARRHRELGLDAADFRRCHALLARALGDGVHWTRDELGAALRAGGVATDGGRLSHLLGHAELHGVVCGGAPRGKRATYARRAPRRGAPWTREAALAALALRYSRAGGRRRRPTSPGGRGSRRPRRARAWRRSDVAGPRW